MQPQVIVCGLGRTGYRIFSILRQQGIHVTGISNSPLWSPHTDRVMSASEQAAIIVGNLRSEETLIQAGIKGATTLLLACGDDALNIAILTQARLLNPRIRIVNRLFSVRLGERLDSTLSDHISMSVAALVAPIFAFAGLGNQVIGQLQLFNRNWPITETTIDETHPWCGISLAALWENRSRMLLAYFPLSGNSDLMSAIAQQQCLQPGDRLVVSNRPNTHKKRRWRPLWQGWGKGFLQFRRQSQAVLLVLLALLLTIGIATLTYLSANSNISVVDALYFSVGMITGAGGQEAVAESSSALVKVFTAVMMLVGTGVIGICYALLNDFILGSHLQQVWSAAQIPHSGHQVICGLGGVGCRIVDQLKETHTKVVAIESNPNGRFIAAARAQRIPVLIGDASVPETLRVANLQQASALLAVTSDDTVNLEIAITAKSLAPKLPVLVRVHDAKFAAQIQRVFDFDMVMSPTELAAPTFAAAAIGGRIFGNCMTRDGLWIAIATLITPKHPFCDRTLQEAAATEKFTPLYVEFNGQAIQGRALLTHVLKDGTILRLMMPVHRWQQLWSQERNEPIREWGVSNRISC
jgi:voltage-gated potassium channel Kch